MDYNEYWHKYKNTDNEGNLKIPKWEKGGPFYFASSIQSKFKESDSSLTHNNVIFSNIPLVSEFYCFSFTKDNVALVFTSYI